MKKSVGLLSLTMALAVGQSAIVAALAAGENFADNDDRRASHARSRAVPASPMAVVSITPDFAMKRYPLVWNSLKKSDFTETKRLELVEALAWLNDHAFVEVGFSFEIMEKLIELGDGFRALKERIVQTVAEFNPDLRRTRSPGIPMESKYSRSSRRLGEAAPVEAPIGYVCGKLTRNFTRLTRERRFDDVYDEVKRLSRDTLEDGSFEKWFPLFAGYFFEFKGSAGDLGEVRGKLREFAEALEGNMASRDASVKFFMALERHEPLAFLEKSPKAIAIFFDKCRYLSEKLELAFESFGECVELALKIPENRLDDFIASFEGFYKRHEKWRRYNLLYFAGIFARMPELGKNLGYPRDKFEFLSNMPPGAFMNELEDYLKALESGRRGFVEAEFLERLWLNANHATAKTTSRL